MRRISLLLLLAVACGGAEVTAFVPPASLELSAQDSVTTVGDSLIFHVVGSDVLGRKVPTGPVTYQSADPATIEVSDAGVAHAKRPGRRVPIIARLANGFTDTALVYINPPAGTYDVTTTLTSFSFETPAPSPPDCPTFTLYCTHVRSFSGASLAGSFTVSANGVVATFEGQYCAAWDLASPVGCTRTQYASPTVYTSTLRELYGSESWPFFTTVRVGGTSERAIYLYGNFTGDSLYGGVSWSSSITRSPPTSGGTFVARRRK